MQQVQGPATVPATGFIRQRQLLGAEPVTEEQAELNRRKGQGPRRARPGEVAVVPVSASTWWRWIAQGKAPRPVKLSDRVTAWRAEDIQAFMAAQGSGQ